MSVDIVHVYDSRPPGATAEMVVATIEQLGRPMPAPEHALKNAFVVAGLLLVGPGRYSLEKVFRRGRRG